MEGLTTARLNLCLKGHTIMPKISSLLIACTLLGGYASGLAIRHDVQEADYVVFGQTFPAVVEIGGLGSGTLVGPDWVLTAAHVPELLQRMLGDKPLTVSIDGEPFEVVHVAIPEERKADREHHDIALLKLEKPVPDELIPLPLWTKKVKVGTEFALAGWGTLAKGDTGVKISRKSMAAPTRKLRAGMNAISRRDDEKNLLLAQFDSPDDALELEAGPCIGDSGGPLLIRVEGKDDEPDTWHVAGVMAHVDDADEDLIIGEYGDEFGMTSVLAYVDWLEEMLED